MSKVDKFGKYLLLEKLAVGGMAEVYLAKSSGVNGVNKLVAIKKILPQFSNNEEFVAMFKEEAKVAINLNHSNIVSIYDFGIENDQFYLVMEFVNGRNLRQIINELKKQNKSLTLDQSVFVIKEAAAGLNHAHRCTDSNSGRPLNITHRDMSPQNVMISFDGEAKVIDFGIAKAESSEDATKAGTLKGKFSYMSPEQAEGFPIDPRTDVYALGIILWELLANDRLFTGSNEGAILRKVRDSQVPSIRKINPMVPPELERIVMKALAKDKNVRYQTAANFHKDLNLFLNTQYPDFSVHDFSQFIRDSFKDSYAEGKEKLISYAKIQNVDTGSVKLPPPPVEALPPKNELENKLKKLAPPDEPSIQIPDELSKVSLDGIRSSFGNKTGLHPNKVKPIFSETRVTQVTNFGKSKGRTPVRNTSNGLSGLTSKALLLVGLSVIGFLGYNHFFKDDAKPSVSSKKGKKSTVAAVQNTANETPNDSGKYEMALEASTKLSVTSNPSGAQIYIDEQDTYQTTPALVNVTANKNLKIKLVKAGYYLYQIERQYSEPSTLDANLSQVPVMGYVDIIVMNGGGSTVISINGNRLSMAAPIKQYAVPANEVLHITAINPLTNLRDDMQVKVLPNKTQTIQLILGRKKAAK